MVSKKILEDYKKQLKNFNFHLETWLKCIVINSWTSEQLREELLRKISFFKEKGYSDVFHPCIDRNLIVRSMQKTSILKVLK